MDGNVTDGAYALADELAEYKQLFEVQYRRMAEATELWRAEDPQARALIQPDLGDLLAWLMDKAMLRPVSVKAVVPLSLGEQPHDPADCFMHQGRPHPGACMDAEAYTRWYWMEGPGSQPLSSTAIALATQRLVAEAFSARSYRLEVARLSEAARYDRRHLDDVLPDQRGDPDALRAEDVYRPRRPGDPDA